MSKKNISEEIRECILICINDESCFRLSKYKTLSNYLKYKHGIIVRNKVIICDFVTAFYLDNFLYKYCNQEYVIQAY